jgi:RNA polymerase sigma-54 factor
MEAGYDLSQEQRPWVSPSLIEANHILSLSRTELQAAITAEMEANPALEMDERLTCPLCGSILDGTYCPTCLVGQQTDQQAEAYEDFPEQLIARGHGTEESDDFDPMTLVASDVSIRDQIMADARTLLESHEYLAGELLVDSIDDRGFLTANLDEVAALSDLDGAAVDVVLEVIQDVAPVGVGARDLRECLMLQVDYLVRSGQEVPEAVARIVDSHLAELGAHKYGQIARELDLTTDEVEAARDYIRTYLNPFPLQTQQAKSWRSPTQSAYVAPDVIISLRDDELVVEVVDTKHSHLRTNSLYAQLAGEVGRRKSSVSANGTAAHANGIASWASSASEDERSHIRHFATRSKLFISNIQQRRETLLKISKCICELQESFLRGGVRELRPLTRAVVAQQVGVHESTVSRATANKYVMLPSRKVIPFSDFFTPSLSTKDVIKELIEREEQGDEPLTDRRICELLLQQGIRIARRTVAKYRAELRILPSTMR